MAKELESVTNQELEFIEGGKEMLDLVKPLWEKLNKHHEENSEYFKEKFRELTFEVRKKKFVENDGLKIKVDLVRDVDKDIFVGYCISTINSEPAGEVDSFFVEEQYRKQGLGDKLMQRALEWLDINKAKTKIIVVAEGNENVLEFYRRYGFYKRRIVLEQV